MIEELQELSSKLGRSPKTKDMKEHGNFSYCTYYLVFGSWNTALEKAGLEKNTEIEIDESELLEHLQSLADELGTTPRKIDMEELGDRSAQTYVDNFGSWNSALKAAGLKLNQRKSVDRKELVTEIRKVHKLLGEVPTLNEVVDHGEFSMSPYFTEFESWENALKSSGLEPAFQRCIDEEELARDLKRLAEKLGREPYFSDLKEEGKYGRRPYNRLFGSFIDAKKALIPDYIGERLWREYQSAKEPYGPNWIEKREEAIERDSEECAECGMGRETHRERHGRDLHVHHIIPRKAYFKHPQKGIAEANRLENLVTLCRECHMDVHHGDSDLNKKYISTMSQDGNPSFP